MKKLGFIGLGVMGSSLVNNFLSDGHEVFVYDINTEAYKKIPKGKPCKSIEELLFKCDDILFLSLPNPESVKEVMLGENGVIQNYKNNLIIVDTTTSSPSLSKIIAEEAAKKNMTFLDAPLIGIIRSQERCNRNAFFGVRRKRN